MKMFKNHPSLRAEVLRAAKGKRSKPSLFAEIASSPPLLAMTIKRILRSQAGYALPLALILLLFGGFFVVPCLNLLYTSLNANIMVDESDLKLYAADAGVEYTLWSLTNDADFQMQVEVLAVDDALPVVFPDQTMNGMTAVGVAISNEGGQTYKITSTALSADGDSTTVESRVESRPGENLAIFDSGLASETDITLAKSCNVTGDIYYEDTFTYQEPFYHDDGEVTQGGLEWPSQEEIEAFAQTYKDEALAGGTHYGDYTIGIGDGTTITDLGPLYITGNLSIAKDNIINIVGTIYVEGYIDVDKDSEFTGSGSIIAVGDMYLSKMADYGTEGDTVIMSLTGNITFKKEATIEALIYAPDGTVSFDKGADVTGAIVAADIQADKEGTFTFESSSEGLELPGYTHGWQVTTYTIE